MKISKCGALFLVLVVTLNFDSTFFCSDLIQNGALNSLISMAQAASYGSLRFLSTKILRVISEGCYGHIRQLCNAEAVLALGKILLNDINLIRSSIENSLASSGTSDLIHDSLSNEFLTSTTSEENMLNEVSHVLSGLINILYSRPSLSVDTYGLFAALQKAQLNACLQLITSDGINSLLWIARRRTLEAELELVLEGSKLETIARLPNSFHDIQVDSWQVLASLCPLLLSQDDLTNSATKWTPYVLSALIEPLKEQSLLGVIPGIYVEMLQGLGCLADWEPLKTRIIDDFLPHLMDLHRHGNKAVSNAAMQVCLSLGFNEVNSFNEVESGANAAYLLGDKFVLARSRLVQAMAREELRHLLKDIWTPSKVADTQLRENEEQSYESNELTSLFTFLCQDADTVGLREQIRRQFISLYGSSPEPTSQRTRSLQSVTSLDRKSMKRTMHRSGSYIEAEEFDRFNRGRKYSGPKSSTDFLSSHRIENIDRQAFSGISVSSSMKENKVRYGIFLNIR